MNTKLVGWFCVLLGMLGQVFGLPFFGKKEKRTEAATVLFILGVYILNHGDHP